MLENLNKVGHCGIMLLEVLTERFVGKNFMGKQAAKGHLVEAAPECSKSKYTDHLNSGFAEGLTNLLFIHSGCLDNCKLSGPYPNGTEGQMSERNMKQITFVEDSDSYISDKRHGFCAWKNKELDISENCMSENLCSQT
jgi:hypothetical protein